MVGFVRTPAEIFCHPLQMTHEIHALTEKGDMTDLICQMRKITQVRYMFKPGDAACDVSRSSLSKAEQWRMVCYNAIARLAVAMHYIRESQSSLDTDSPDNAPTPLDVKSICETRTSFQYLVNVFDLQTERFSGLSRDLGFASFRKRRSYSLAALVWFKSRLKVEALNSCMYWLCFSIKRFIRSMVKFKDYELSDNGRIVLLMDAEIIETLCETLFNTALISYTELITL
jgi:hypothetical protein